jgi:hypothetical protein
MGIPLRRPGSRLSISRVSDERGHIAGSACVIRWLMRVLCGHENGRSRVLDLSACSGVNQRNDALAHRQLWRRGGR